MLRSLLAEVCSTAHVDSRPAKPCIVARMATIIPCPQATASKLRENQLELRTPRLQSGDATCVHCNEVYLASLQWQQHRKSRALPSQACLPLQAAATTNLACHRFSQSPPACTAIPALVRIACAGVVLGTHLELKPRNEGRDIASRSSVICMNKGAPLPSLVRL